MSIHLIFANTSVKNTTVKCDSLGIHYDVSAKHGIVSVTRWDSSTDQMVPIGQFHLPVVGKDQVKLAKDAEWRPLNEVLHKKDGLWWLPNKSFVAEDGTAYQWKLQWKGVLSSFMLCYDDPQRGTEPLVKYHLHRLSSSNPTYLEVTDSSLLSSLDIIILTFLMMETRKREVEAGIAD
ncbi:hypothetical protein CPB86DRAFT_107651 [Serendipita vermifera]|nr:hypothetical protein CPB86DRAFT_107651 [Serendipita vermifera]